MVTLGGDAMWQTAGSADLSKMVEMGTGRIIFGPNPQGRPDTWPEIDPSIFNVPPRSPVFISPGALVERFDSEGNKYLDFEEQSMMRPGGEVRATPCKLSVAEIDAKLASLIRRSGALLNELIELKASL